MSKEDELEKMAIYLFEIAICKGMILSYEEGLDKIDMMPMRAKWENAYEIEKRYWRNQAVKELEGKYIIE